MHTFQNRGSAGKHISQDFSVDISQRLTVDLDELEDWMDFHSGPGQLERGVLARDVYTARALRAWERQDAQTFMDAMTRVENSDIFGKAGRPPSEVGDQGSIPHLSDLFGSLTTNRVKVRWTHSNSYLKTAFLRRTEMWANMTSVSSTGPMGRKVLDRFVSRIYRLFAEEYGLDASP